MSLQTIDFSRPQATPRLGGWLLALGAALLATVVWVDRHWAAERADAERLRQAQLEAQRVVQRPAVRREPTATERRAQRARAELQRPWLAALRAIEAATTDPVYLLSASFELSSGTIKLEAEAPSFEHALAYTQVLPDGAGLASATLASHDPVPDPVLGRPAVHFTVLARWSTP